MKEDLPPILRRKPSRAVEDRAIDALFPVSTGDVYNDVARTKRRQRLTWLFLVSSLLLLLSIFSSGFFLFAVLVIGGLWMVSSLWVRASLDALEVRRELSREECDVGEVVDGSLTLANRKDWPAWWLFWREQADAGLDVEGPERAFRTLGGKATETLEYRLHTLRRGLFRVGPAMVEASGPFGLPRRYWVDGQARFLTVLPQTVAIGQGWPLGHRPVHEVPRRRLYGRARLRYEAWQKARGEEPRRQDVRLQHSRSSRSVARLGMIGLLIFALGEPFLLAGPPHVGLQALAAMIVFLLAGGIVLASGSATGTYQLVRAQEGRVSLGVVPSRVIVGAVVMVLLVALAAAFPGVHYRGTGLLQPEPPVGDGLHLESGDPGEASNQDPGARQDPQSGQPGQPPAQSEPGNESSNQATAGVASAAGKLMKFFLTLGKWLWIPFVIIVAVVALIKLGRLLRGGGWQRLGERLSQQFTRLMSSLRFSWRRGTKPAQRPMEDPLAGCESLISLDPDAAITEAYRRLQVFLDQLGYPRPDHQTPHEYLAGLPTRCRPLLVPVRTLTELYVQASYSAAAVGVEDRDQAVEALLALRSG